MLYFCGIDPGYVNGAICLLSEDGKEVLFYDIKEGKDPGLWHRGPAQFLYETVELIHSGAIEKIATSPMQGVVSAGKFYGAYMVLRCLLDQTNKPWKEVVPVKWQESLGVSFVKESIDDEESSFEREKKRQRNKVNLKKSVYAWAKSKYPQAELDTYTKHSNRADALGVAHWVKTLAEN